jgi:hypothetical protein
MTDPATPLLWLAFAALREWWDYLHWAALADEVGR